MSLDAPDAEVDICNLALIQLKQDLIAQIDPPKSKAEKICAQFYQQVRRATLRAHPWNFAVRRTTITPTGTAPLFGFTHAYDLPPDWLRYLSRHDDLGIRIKLDEIDSFEDYQIEGRQILLNGEDTSSIKLRYLTDFTNVVQMDPLFIDLFVINLAIKIAPNFSSSEARQRELKAQRKDIQHEARATDGQERPPIRIERSRWLTARRTSGRVASKFTRFF